MHILLDYCAVRIQITDLWIFQVDGKALLGLLNPKSFSNPSLKYSHRMHSEQKTTMGFDLELARTVSVAFVVARIKLNGPQSNWITKAIIRNHVNKIESTTPKLGVL